MPDRLNILDGPARRPAPPPPIYERPCAGCGTKIREDHAAVLTSGLHPGIRYLFCDPTISPACVAGWAQRMAELAPEMGWAP